ncbi:hypothetical protein ACLKMH_01220 [Psychromonas sp. KJ10-10]|uniref:hypothetical protein n=1 Tax=Psychromonas sp. KJ10-10 TaxID=3391823 RepID=UPI0039B4B775
MKAVQVLSQQLEESKIALRELYSDVDGIKSILTLIQGIADQTNLLALNRLPLKRLEQENMVEGSP